MENIEKILSDAGIEGDKATEIKAKVEENYRTVAEVNQKADKIKELQTQLDQLGEKVKGAEGSEETVKSLQKQLADFKAAQEKAQTEAEEKAARKEFEAKFDDALNGMGKKRSDLLNQITERGVFDEAWKMVSANPELDVSSVVKTVTAGDNIFKTDQRAPHNIPTGDSKDTGDNPMAAVVAKMFGPK